MTLDKRLPVASGIGGGSADAAAALRLLTSLWRIDPAHAQDVAPTLGSDVPACLLSLPMRGRGRRRSADASRPVGPVRNAGLAGEPARGAVDRGGIRAMGRRRSRPARRLARRTQRSRSRRQSQLVPQIETVLAWLRLGAARPLSACQAPARPVLLCSRARQARDAAAESVPREWWHLATFLR